MCSFHHAFDSIVWFQSRTRGAAVAVIMVAAACVDNGGGTDEGAETGSESTEETTDTGTTDDGDEFNCGAPDTPPSVPDGVFVGVGEDPAVLVTPAAQCPLTNAQYQMDPDVPGDDIPAFDLFVLYPLVEGSNDRPEGAFPLVIFQHGEMATPQYYTEYWDAIVPQGALVANIGFPAGTQSYETRPYTTRCAAEYLATNESESLNFDLVLAGHSRGGYATLFASAHMLQNPGDPADFDLRGVWMLSPDARPAAPPITIPPSVGLNGLFIQGSVENDAIGGALSHYERSSYEETALPDSGGEKTLVWAYDVHHLAWGGQPAELAADDLTEHHGELASLVMVAKARAIAVPYVEAFVRRHLVDASDDVLPLLRGEVLPAGTDVDAWWDYLDAWKGEPVISTSRVDGCDAERTVIDDFVRGDDPNLSSEGFPLNMTPEDLAIVRPAGELVAVQHHVPTSVIDVQWQGNGEVEWDLSDLEPDLADAATHLSFRVANVLEMESGLTCAVASIHPDLEFTVELDGPNGPPFSRQITPIVQDYLDVGHPQTAVKICSWKTMMHEVVIPLSDACDAFPVQTIRFVFGGSGSSSGRVFIDSLELRSRPENVPACPP